MIGNTSILPAILGRLWRVLRGIPGWSAVLLTFVLPYLVIHHLYQSVDHDLGEMNREIFEMEELIASEDRWKSKEEWVRETIPRFVSRESALSRLEERLEESSGRFGLEVRSSAPRRGANPDLEAFYNRATIDVVVRGEERAVVEWIHHLQSPGDFTGIDRFSIEAGERDVVCEIAVTQWFLIPAGWNSGGFSSASISPMVR